MKYLKLFESFDELEILPKTSICKKHRINNYTINNDGSIDVNQNVNLHSENLTKIPLKFNKINGWFDCSYNNLTSLEGSPVEVNGYFYCNDNNLTSFKGSPKIIRDSFTCWNNNIKTFEYFPSYVKNRFYCFNNPIWKVWILFNDTTKIELLNDCDIFRDEYTDTPCIVMDRLNDFLLTIGRPEVKIVEGYKNI